MKKEDKYFFSNQEERNLILLIPFFNNGTFYKFEESQVEMLDCTICTWPIWFYMVIQYVVTFEVAAEFCGNELETIVIYNLVRVSKP